MNPISAFAGSERAVRLAALLAMVLVVSAADAAAQLTAEDLARVAWIEETAISPDARWVAYIRSLPAAPGQAARGRARDLFLIPAAGGKPRLLVSAEHAPVSPSWSPDGARLAFIAEIKSRGAHRQVYALPLGDNAPRALTSAPTDVRAFALSPDGRSLGYLAAEPVPESIANRERKGDDAIVYGESGPHVRLFVKGLPEGAPRALTPPDRTVWDFALVTERKGVRCAGDGKYGLDFISQLPSLVFRSSRRRSAHPACPHGGAAGPHGVVARRRVSRVCRRHVDARFHGAVAVCRTGGRRRGRRSHLAATRAPFSGSAGRIRRRCCSAPSKGLEPRSSGPGRLAEASRASWAVARSPSFLFRSASAQD